MDQGGGTYSPDEMATLAALAGVPSGVYARAMIFPDFSVCFEGVAQVNTSEADRASRTLSARVSISFYTIGDGLSVVYAQEQAGRFGGVVH